MRAGDDQKKTPAKGSIVVNTHPRYLASSRFLQHIQDLLYAFAGEERLALISLTAFNDRPVILAVN